jgi:predicted transcriptional regulator
MPDTTFKQKIIDSIEKLPQDASLDDIMERIYFIHKIEVGLKQSEQGDVISHDEVLKKIEKW